MNNQSRFIVRETKEELEKLDRALKTLGYFNRSDWYREKKRELLEKAAERSERSKDTALIPCWKDGSKTDT